MKRKCLDEGVLQGYVDGELAPELMREAEAHLALCAPCMETLREAESELALFADAFAPDASLSVPTDVLRQRIDAAIGELKSSSTAAEHKGSGWGLKGLLGVVAAAFTVAPQRAAAFASLVAVIAFAAIFAIISMRPGSNPPVRNASPQQQIAATAPSISGGQQSPPPAGGAPDETTAGTTPVSSVTAARFDKPKRQHIRRGANTQTGGVTPVAPSDENGVAQKSLPGEENYQQAIASLTRAIDASGDAVLTPSMRADYERNHAVVDTAITETRRAALRNPQDADATAFLFSAYQSKIDLLMAVADQAQSSALGR